MKHLKCFNIFVMSLLFSLTLTSIVKANYINTNTIKETYLREYCSEEAGIIRTLNKNSYIEIMNIQDNWGKAIYNNQVGYVNMKDVNQNFNKDKDYDYYVIVQAVPIELKDIVYGTYIENNDLIEPDNMIEYDSSNVISSDIIPKSKTHVDYTDWQDAKNIFTIGEAAEVYDVLTGYTYYVRSFSNGNHADVEPITKNDTEIMFETFGFEWSWDVRPIWVTINGKTMACSINGMPHAKGVNSDNGMEGQICIHFLNSKTHNGNDNYTKLHQDVAKEAFELSLK